MSNYFVTFINASPVPINIETWQPICFCFSEMKMHTVKSGGKLIMGSETGEWLLNTYFTDNDLSEQWINTGNTQQLGQVIGKFWEEPYAKGRGNSYMCTDNFEITYVNGFATFSKKKNE